LRKPGTIPESWRANLKSMKWEHEMSPVKKKINKISDDTGTRYSPELEGTNP
jgi:hypothetical protein